MIALLIGYMWLFIHRPFEIWPVLATVRLERLYMIVTIVYWCMNRPMIPAGNKLHRYFLLWLIVMTASWVMSPYSSSGNQAIENLLKYSVFYVMLVTTVKNRDDLHKIVVGFCGVMSIYMAHSLREYMCGNVWYAQGISRMRSLGSTFRDYNDCAGLIVSALPMAWVLWQDWKHDYKKWLIYGYFLLSAICVYLTASRMGAAGTVVAALLAAVASPKRLQVLTCLVLLGAIAWAGASEKHRTRYLTLLNSSEGNESARISAGHLRMGGFETGLELFSVRPILGWGPGSAAQATGHGMMLHNMYGQILAELGLCGALSFGLIIWGCFGNVFQARRIARDAPYCEMFAYNTTLAAAASFLLLLFMGWGFNFLFWHVWLWFGAFQVIALQVLKQEAFEEIFEDDEQVELTRFDVDEFEHEHRPSYS